MRTVSSRTHFPSVTLFAFLIFNIHTLAAAPQQDSAAQPTASATLSQALSESSAALQRHDYEAARQAAWEATKLDPRSQAGWFNLAYSQEMLGDYPSAEEGYKNLIAINPRHSSAYNNLGVVYQKTGRPDEAMASYRKQIEMVPRGRFACANLAAMLASRGQWEEARQWAALAAELSPQDVRRWHLLAKVQIKTGQLDEAHQSFERLLALPHDAMMDNNVSYDMADAGIEIARSWELVSKAMDATVAQLCEPQALSDGDKCTAPLRQMSFMLDTAGWVLYRQGKTKEAEPYLRSSFAITPRSETELHLAVILANSGRLEEAAALFAQARTRRDFSRLDSKETIRELMKAAGGDAELDAILERMPVPTSPSIVDAKAVALVDANGKILDARPDVPSFLGLVEAAKSLTLPALSWPGHSLRSVRTIDFQHIGEQWSPSQSYAGETPPPPPCGIAKPPVLLTQGITPTAPSSGCPGAF